MQGVRRQKDGVLPDNDSSRPRGPGLYLEARLHAVLRGMIQCRRAAGQRPGRATPRTRWLGKSLGPLPEGAEKPLPSPLSPGPPRYVPVAGSGSHLLIICLEGGGGGDRRREGSVFKRVSP